MSHVTQIRGSVYDNNRISIMYTYITIDRGESNLRQLNRIAKKKDSSRKVVTCNVPGKFAVVTTGVESIGQLVTVVDRLVNILGPFVVKQRLSQ